jgi:hypothetical protein
MGRVKSLSAALVKMAVDEAPGMRPVTVKSIQGNPEIRDTVAPSIVTNLLITVL